VNYEEIIQGCKLGDRKCQNSLVQTVAPRLLAVCKRYCPESNAAEDALQETFINVFRYIHTFDGRGSFEGWLRRVAVTSCLAVKKKYNKIDFTCLPEEDFDLHHEVPDVYSHFGIEDILKLLENLPQSLRIVFNMYVIEGFNHQEISEILNITESTSRANLTKARARLINMLEERSTESAKSQSLRAAFYPKLSWSN
jgi:RNA polymerase sigma-70 factor (ECF subfamily)